MTFRYLMSISIFLCRCRRSRVRRRSDKVTRRSWPYGSTRRPARGSRDRKHPAPRKSKRCNTGKNKLQEYSYHSVFLDLSKFLSIMKSTAISNIIRGGCISIYQVCQFSDFSLISDFFRVKETGIKLIKCGKNMDNISMVS